MIKHLITVAPTGARRQKTDHIALPMRTDEIATEALACFKAGASQIHLHVREKDGAHSLDADKYLQAIKAVAKSTPDMNIQITTESGGIFSPKEQLHCLKSVKPNAASVSVREVIAEPSVAHEIYQFARDQNVELQHILYSLEDIKLFQTLMDQEIISQDQNDVLIVLGNYAGQVGSIKELHQKLDALPDGMNWTVCSFGGAEETCLLEAIKLGGSARVGFENNLHLKSGKVAVSNAELVKSLAHAIEMQNQD